VALKQLIDHTLNTGALGTGESSINKTVPRVRGQTATHTGVGCWVWAQHEAY
jgi:hypothetical protein